MYSTIAGWTDVNFLLQGVSFRSGRNLLGEQRMLSIWTLMMWFSTAWRCEIIDTSGFSVLSRLLLIASLPFEKVPPVRWHPIRYRHKPTITITTLKQAQFLIIRVQMKWSTSTRIKWERTQSVSAWYQTFYVLLHLLSHASKLCTFFVRIQICEI